jgi:hypothetical protein
MSMIGPTPLLPAPMMYSSFVHASMLAEVTFMAWTEPTDPA